MAAFLGRFGRWLYRQPYLLVSLTYLMWAINIVLGRYASGHIPPVALGTWRWVFAALILFPFAWPYLRRDWPVIRSHLVLLVALGLTGTTGFSAAAYWGLQYTEAINALLIQCTLPMIVGVLSFAMFGDRLNGGQMLGIVLSFLGIAVILTRADPDVLRAISFNRGDVWFFGAMLVMAGYSALVKRRPAMHPISLLAMTAVLGSLCIAPVYLWEVLTQPPAVIDMKTAAIVAYAAIFPSLLSYLCFNRGVELVGPNRATALYPLTVVFGSVIAMLFLGEEPRLHHVIGFVFVIGGLLLATRTPRAAAQAPIRI